MLKYALASLATVGVLTLVGCQDDAATVGGTPVPKDLQCEEDEVIGFNGVPDTLFCLHPDDLR